MQSMIMPKGYSLNANATPEAAAAAMEFVRYMTSAGCAAADRATGCE